MDDLLLLLILDRVSGGAYRGVVNFVGFLVAVGLFFAHPILGIIGLIIWGALWCAIELTVALAEIAMVRRFFSLLGTLLTWTLVGLVSGMSAFIAVLCVGIMVNNVWLSVIGHR